MMTILSCAFFRHEFGCFYPATDDGFYTMIGDEPGVDTTLLPLEKMVGVGMQTILQFETLFWFLLPRNLILTYL